MKKLVVLLAIILLALLAFAPAASAQGTGPEQVVTAFITAFNGGKYTDALALFADTATVRTPADVYVGKGLAQSWLEARIDVDKVKYELVAGSLKVDGNKVTWQIKPSSGSNLLAEATIENGKITSLVLKNPPAPTAAPAAAAAAAPAAQATAAPTPSALPTTGATENGLSLLWLAVLGVVLVGVGLAARRLNA